MVKDLLVEVVLPATLQGLPLRLYLAPKLDTPGEPSILMGGVQRTSIQIGSNLDA